MSVHLYKPNKNNTGHACSFSQSPKDGTIFGTLIKQSGWDAANQVGSFKASRNDPKKHVNIKLGQVEVAAILDCLDRNRAFSTVHDGDHGMKTINFSPWMEKLSQESLDEGLKPSCKGYSFSITCTDKQDSTSKVSLYIGLTFAEGRLIREFLIYALQNAFSNSNAKFEDVEAKSQALDEI